MEATPYTVFVFLLIPIFIGIGILGGLGAGMIKRPIFNLMLNYPSNVANQVTDILVFSGGLFNALVLFFEKYYIVLQKTSRSSGHAYNQL